ncbi:MAG: hypothetical protein Q9227_001072 [Pyrenula ochraceoflavens]
MASKYLEPVSLVHHAAAYSISVPSSPGYPFPSVTPYADDIDSNPFMSETKDDGMPYRPPTPPRSPCRLPLSRYNSTASLPAPQIPSLSIESAKALTFSRVGSPKMIQIPPSPRRCDVSPLPTPELTPNMIDDVSSLRRFDISPLPTPERTPPPTLAPPTASTLLRARHAPTNSTDSDTPPSLVSCSTRASSEDERPTDRVEPLAAPNPFVPRITATTTTTITATRPLQRSFSMAVKGGEVKKKLQRKRSQYTSEELDGEHLALKKGRNKMSLRGIGNLILSPRTVSGGTHGLSSQLFLYSQAESN